MQANERNVAIATAGLAIVAVGAFLPWARIGGRSRSGFATADTFIDLAEGIAPDVVVWAGRWWYGPAFLLLIAWALTFASGTTLRRALGGVLVAIALVMWWLFAWAGWNYGVVNTRWLGPIIASVGAAIVAWATTRQRESLLSS